MSNSGKRNEVPTPDKLATVAALGWCFDMSKAPKGVALTYFAVRPSGIYSGIRVLRVRYNSFDNVFEYQHSHGWFAWPSEWDAYAWIAVSKPPSPPSAATEQSEAPQ